MEARTDRLAEDGGTAPPEDPANGTVRRTPTGGPTTADGARYLEELRAQWRARPKDGPRLFNPDETPEEREERIRETLVGLELLQERAEKATGDDRITWERVMTSVAQSRSRQHTDDSAAPRS